MYSLEETQSFFVTNNTVVPTSTSKACFIVHIYTIYQVVLQFLDKNATQNDCVGEKYTGYVIFMPINEVALGNANQ
jgi:hypothetical protein